MTESTLSSPNRIYNTFHPWSSQIPQEERCGYWVSFVAIAILTVCILPIIYYIGYYGAQGLSSLCGRASNANQNIEVTEDQEEAFELPKPRFREAYQEQHYELLKKEIALVSHLDNGPTNSQWLKHENWDPTFDYFMLGLRSIDHKPLYIQLIGNFSSEDLKVINLLKDFMQAFHRREVHVVEQVITINELESKSEMKIPFKNRNWDGQNVDQYEANTILHALKKIKGEYVKEQGHYIAFTSEFLYAIDLQNFVFGLGQLGGTGVFSNYLFGSAEDNFRTVLARMMKIAAHEFGHMLCLEHCGAHECNIGGYMNLAELDSRPCYYCSKDTAKLCYIKEVTMKEYYKDLLAYFEGFKKTQNTSFFDKEIAHVSKKLAVLEANPQIYDAPKQEGPSNS